MLTDPRIAQSEMVETLYDDLKRRPPSSVRPSSTYRMQFNRDFRFTHAEALVPYLKELGITHVYASPCFLATPGSPHGYDVFDPGVLNPDVGTPEDFKRLIDTLKRNGMGLIMDFVSNHVGIGGGNPYWMDVLEGGQASPLAHYFDIDWHPTRPDLAGRILVPILGDQYGAVLERGELNLSWRDDGFYLSYFDNVLPVSVNSWGRILGVRLEQLPVPERERLLPLLEAIAGLPSCHQPDPSGRRVGAVRRIRATLQALAVSPVVRVYIEQAAAHFNGQPGLSTTFDALDQLLGEQPYRLADWRVAGEEINYRRFFDINSLAAIRMEDEAVFQRMHRLVARWMADNDIDGLRIDHPDGLYDPAGYFAHLQEEYLVGQAKRRWSGAGDWAVIEQSLRDRYREDLQEGRAPSLVRPLYVVAEKVLAHSEHTPGHWAIDGTTGYEFLNVLNGLFVDQSNDELMDQLYARFIRKRINFNELVYRKKRLIMADAVASEINMLALRLARLAHRNRKTRDFTLNSLRRALVEYVACLGVYRTYVAGGTDGVEPRDQRYIEEAIGRARRKAAALDPSIFDFLQQILLLQDPDALVFVMKLQQLTGAIMAKGMEDTCFYIYNRLISLNEVGGEPQRFGSSVWEFHARNRERASNWPGALSTTSTHDTKRSEDVRARINVLSEIPELWKYHLWLWNRIHLIHKRRVNGRLAPDRNEEMYLYQTLVGTWPRSLSLDETYRERVRNTMRKALREAKLHTSWLNNNLEYEEAVLGFVDEVLHTSQPFMADMIPFMRRVVLAGLHNSLSQLLLKIASPGVPDVYQGCELWDDSLVDPDNRRPADFELRNRLLAELQHKMEHGDVRRLAHELYLNIQDPLEDGRLKLFVTMRALRFRREHADLFRRGRYIPLEATERLREHVCAFARQSRDQLVMAVVPRRVYHLLGKDGLLSADTWEETWIPLPGLDPAVSQRFRNVLTGGVLSSEVYDERAGLRLSKVLGDFPVALLERL